MLIIHLQPNRSRYSTSERWLTEEDVGIRRRLGRGPPWPFNAEVFTEPIWRRESWCAYLVGIIIFLLATGLMWRIDYYHEGMRARAPLYTAYHLFENPLEKYAEVQVDAQRLVEIHEEARDKVDAVVKSMKRCVNYGIVPDHEVGEDHGVEQCVVADHLHKFRDDFVKFQLQGPRALVREVKDMCRDLDAFESEVEQNDPNNYQVKALVDELVHRRKDHATVCSRSQRMCRNCD